MAFGRRDSFLPGFAGAVAGGADARLHAGVRGAGGRAAAYDEGCLVFDEIMPAADSMTGIQARFSDEAELQARALRNLGVDARVGEVPGEYCPGEFSVNARGETKLIGAAQRIVRGGWLLSTVVVVDPPAASSRARGRLRALGLDWDPATTGSVADEVPGVSVEDVRDAILAEYAERTALTRRPLAAEELAAAIELVGRYRV